MVRAPPRSFQPPMFQNTGFNPCVNMNMNNNMNNMNNYGQQNDAPSGIVSYAPGRARPGASSQIYGNTICSPLDKETVSTEQTQQQLPATTVIASPSNDTISTNNINMNQNQIQNNFSDNQQFGLHLFV